MRRLLLLLSLAPWAVLAQEPTLCPPGATELLLEARAEREVANDTLHARLIIEREGPEPSSLADEVNQRANEALQAARGVAGLRLSSGAYLTQPVYAPKSRSVERWRVRHELVLEAKDFSAAMRFIARQQERLVLDGLGFGLSPALRTATETELMQQAAQALQARAEALRQTLGRSRVELRRLQLSPQGGVPPRPMARAMLMEAAGAPPLEVEGGHSTLVVQAMGTACVLP